MGTWTVPAPPVPDFALSTAMDTYNVPIGIGTPVSYTLTVTPQNGFNSPVRFSMPGMWGCTTPVFSPAVVTGPPWTTTLTMSCYATGMYSVCATVVATGGVQAHQLVLILNYTSSVQYYLSTMVSPAGSGSIYPASGWYPANTQVPVTASANPGYQFKEFSGDLGGTRTPQYLTMNSAKSVTAIFSAATGGINGVDGSGPDLTTISTIVPSFPNVSRPSGGLPSFSPQSSVLINRATINRNPALPPAVIQQNGGNNVAVFNVSSVSVPTGVTVEVGDFDFVVFNSAGPVSVTGQLQSDGPRVAMLGGDQTISGTYQAIGIAGGSGGNGGAPSVYNYVPSGGGGNGGGGGDGGSASAGTHGYNGQGGGGFGGGGGGGWPGGTTAATGRVPRTVLDNRYSVLPAPTAIPRQHQAVAPEAATEPRVRKAAADGPLASIRQGQRSVLSMSD